MSQTHTDDDATDIAGQMTEYGITRKSVDQFHFGDYRYSNFRDALAEAKRSSANTKSGDDSVSA